ncbi:MAG: hypothetical protein RJB38_1570 [Pseudomonadota bacterium]|jgi:UDP-N-acetylglucosamine 2-epimerase (non-hydrolysing)
MKSVSLIVGTRPEVIKMAPVYRALKQKTEFQTSLICTGQHRELLDQALRAFDLKPDTDLRVMTPNQTLSSLTSILLVKLEEVFRRQRPDLVLVHGDTTTCFSTALSCFYHGIPIAHVEAGLRTYRLDSPFPEEFNRQSVARLAELHFAPDEDARANLIREGINDSKIRVTGTTAIDSVRTIQSQGSPLHDSSPLSLITLHRREQGAEQLRQMLLGIREAAHLHSNMTFIYPLHPNPLVREVAQRTLGGARNIRLTDPIEYREFIGLLSQASLVVTDSGGIQEEAACLGRRTLVLRERSERTNGLETGQASIIGIEQRAITEAIHCALSEPPGCLPLPTPEKSPSTQIATEVLRRLA